MTRRATIDFTIDTPDCPASILSAVQAPFLVSLFIIYHTVASIQETNVMMVKYTFVFVFIIFIPGHYFSSFVYF